MAPNVVNANESGMQTAKLAVDFGLVVLIWLVQLIIYPSFRYMPPEQLAVWHPKYTNLITGVVGPLMLAQVALHGYGLLARPSAVGGLAAGLIGLAWAITAFGAVPLHNQIGLIGNVAATDVAATDAAPTDVAATDVANVVERLVTVNWVRTLGWTLVFALSVLQWLRSGPATT